jgi:hypothetical protein
MHKIEKEIKVVGSSNTSIKRQGRKEVGSKGGSEYLKEALSRQIRGELKLILCLI